LLLCELRSGRIETEAGITAVSCGQGDLRVWIVGQPGVAGRLRRRFAAGVEAVIADVAADWLRHCLGAVGHHTVMAVVTLVAAIMVGMAACDPHLGDVLLCESTYMRMVCELGEVGGAPVGSAWSSLPPRR
jgi:hypothetical protein